MKASIRSTPRDRQCSTIAPRLGRVEGQRLLAEDVLAGVGRGHHPGLVQLVGQRDVDRVDLGVGQDLVVAAVALGDAELLRPLPREPRVPAGQRGQAACPGARIPGIKPRRLIRAQPRMPQRRLMMTSPLVRARPRGLRPSAGMAWRSAPPARTSRGQYSRYQPRGQRVDLRAFRSASGPPLVSSKAT